MARNVIYGYYDGKKVVLASGIQSSVQTVVSKGAQHGSGALTILQEVLNAGQYSDRVSLFTEGELAMVLYLTAGQYAVFEAAVVPTLSILGVIAPHAFDQMWCMSWSAFVAWFLWLMGVRIDWLAYILLPILVGFLIRQATILYRDRNKTYD